MIQKRMKKYKLCDLTSQMQNNKTELDYLNEARNALSSDYKEPRHLWNPGLEGQTKLLN